MPIQPLENLLASWQQHSPASSFIPILYATSALLLVLFSYLLYKRRSTGKWLQTCGLPVVYWRPRFRLEPQPNQILKSSSITGILPRMARLQGPYQMYGTVYGVSTAVVHIAHPVPARLVLSSSHTKNPAYNHFYNFSGSGVFTADGEEWRAKRASVLHCLVRQKQASNDNDDHGSSRHGIEQETNRAAEFLLKDLQHAVQQQNNGGIVDNIVPLLQRATIGLIYRYITHDDDMDTRRYIPAEEETNNSTKQTKTPPSPASSCSSLTSLGEPTATATSETESLSKNVQQQQQQVDKDESPLLLHGEKTDETPRDASSSCSSLLKLYLKSVTDIRMVLLAQSRSVWFLLPQWCYNRWFSRMYRREEETMGPIREFAARACRAAKPHSPLALLQTQPSHGCDSTEKKHAAISKPLLDEAITILFAGQDTSAATLSWTCHLLSLYPSVQERLYRELTGVDDNTKRRAARMMMKKKLPYLHAVLKESMRLYPVAPFVVRRLTKRVAVDAQTTLPRGALACVWIYGLHRHPDLWESPNDFIPERWLLDEDTKQQQQQQQQRQQQQPPPLRSGAAFMPFAAGPRNCVGQPLANVVLPILLAKLVTEYELRDPALEAGMDPKTLLKDMQAGFTVLPAGGVRLAIRKRATA